MTSTKIPKLRFKEFSDEWQEKKLGELFTNTGGTTLESRVVADGTHKFISIGNYSTNGRYIDNKQRINLDDKTRSKLLRKDNLVMVLNDKTTSGDLIGSTILIGSDDEYIYNQRSERLVCNSGVLPKYAWFLLNSKQFRKKIFSISQGGTQIYVNYPIVKKLKVFLPGRLEQLKAADFLTDVDDRIEMKDKKVKLLEKYKKGMMQQIFSQQVRFKNENGNDYPEWQVKKLEDIFSQTKGAGISKDKVVKDGINPCLLYGELYTTYKEVIHKVKSKTNIIEGVRSKDGDLLVPCSTTTTGIDLANITEIQQNDVLLGGDITILRFKKSGSSSFYAYYLTHFKTRQIARYAQGSTIVHLYYNHFKSMKIDEPSVAEQQKIANFLISIDDKIDLEKSRLKQAKQFKKALLQRMFV